MQASELLDETKLKKLYGDDSLHSLCSVIAASLGVDTTMFIPLFTSLCSALCGYKSNIVTNHCGGDDYIN
jgi:hypothetical protein